MHERIRLFVDMDGTVAKFNPLVKIEALYEEGYFKNLEPMTNMVEAIKNVAETSKEIEVFILSACLDSKYAMPEKNDWLDKHLPIIDTQHRIFCEYGKEKSAYIPEPKETDVLLDDYTKNLKEWNGIGIKILNGINDTNKSWCGQRISSFLEPNILAYTIKNNVLSAIVSHDSIKVQKTTAEKIVKAQSKAIEKPTFRKEKAYGR